MLVYSVTMKTIKLELCGNFFKLSYVAAHERRHCLADHQAISQQATLVATLQASWWKFFSRQHLDQRLNTSGMLVAINSTRHHSPTAILPLNTSFVRSPYLPEDTSNSPRHTTTCSFKYCSFSEHICTSYAPSSSQTTEKYVFFWVHTTHCI